MMIVRYIKPDDMEQIAALYREQNLEVPQMSETTLVAVEGGTIHAIFSARVECHVEWICKENIKGYRAGFKAFTAGENMLKAQGVEGYEVGILRNSTPMREIAEKVGFETWGQLLYEKKLDRIIK
jgi:hypothetical protein